MIEVAHYQEGKFSQTNPVAIKSRLNLMRYLSFSVDDSDEAGRRPHQHDLLRHFFVDLPLGNGLQQLGPPVDQLPHSGASTGC